MRLSQKSNKEIIGDKKYKKKRLVQERKEKVDHGLGKKNRVKFFVLIKSFCRKMLKCRSNNVKAGKKVKGVNGTLLMDKQDIENKCRIFLSTVRKGKKNV